MAVAVALMALLAGGVLLFAFREARSDPIVRRAAVALPGWPIGTPPMSIALASDIHLGGAAMDGERLSRIGDQVTALRPDLIVLAGDFVAGHEPGSARRIAAALATGSRHFRAPLGTVAVLGNHDHWTGAAVVRRALQAGGCDGPRQRQHAPRRDISGRGG